MKKKQQCNQCKKKNLQLLHIEETKETFKYVCKECFENIALNKWVDEQIYLDDME